MKIKLYLIVFLVVLIFTGCGGNKYINIVKHGSFNDYPDYTVDDLMDAFIDNGAVVTYEYLRADDNKDYVNINIETVDLIDMILQFRVSAKRDTFALTAVELDGENATQSEISEFVELLVSIYKENEGF